jgi:hypothetical protein
MRSRMDSTRLHRQPLFPLALAVLSADEVIG